MRNQGFLLSLKIGVVFLLFGLNSFAWGMGRRSSQYLMANIGDSMTAATFADTTTFLPFSFFQTLRGELAFDSIQTLALIENKKSYSWASGRWIDSHYMKLRRSMRSENVNNALNIMNIAVPGSEAKDTLVQAQKIVDAMKSGAYLELKYVTLLIGANDACSNSSSVGTPHEDFREHLRETFRKLAEVQQDEPIRVLVSSIPNIPVLGRPEIAKHTTMGVMSCDFFRHEVLGFCKSLTRWESESDFNEKVLSIIEKNEIIRAVVEESAELYPNLSLVYSDALYRFEITTDLLAMDCFHPNQKGQEQLSQILWNDQHWF